MRVALLVAADHQLVSTLTSTLSELGFDVVARLSLDDPPGTDVALVVIDASSSSLQGQDIASLIGRAKEEHAAPVIVLTAGDAAAVEARKLASAHAVKPVSARELAATIELALVRHESEKRATERERWYRATLRCIVDGIITTDDAARITFMNPTAEQLTGVSEADAIGKDLNDVFIVDSETTDVGAEAGNAPTLRLMRKSGPGIVVEHNTSPIVDERGALLGVIIVFRDITERRRIEQRLALSDRMASIGTLAAGIAHELNNPLAFVTSNLEFVLQELTTMKKDVDARTHELDRAAFADSLGDSIDAIREASSGAARAAAIVKDMKVFMRANTDPGVVVDVNRAVGLALRLTANELKHRADVVVEQRDDVPPVLADEGKLVQVIVNVMTNAVQALDEKEHHTIRVTTRSLNGRAVISISDTGRGIPSEHLRRIFEPFFTTKPVGEGLGLGLSIAHSIITSFGGTISAMSDVDVGTTLTIALPAAKGALASEAAKSAPKADGKKPSLGRVLVVDDEALIGTAIRRILTKHGLDVVVEQEGKKALERMKSGEQFDVVLCDLMMPGFSGVDLYEEVGRQAPKMATRFVFMTGNAFTPKASELFEHTSNVRLEKPFIPSDLTGAVTEVMRRHGVEVAL